jgi:hypothetical protein
MMYLGDLNAVLVNVGLIGGPAKFVRLATLTELEMPQELEIEGAKAVRDVWGCRDVLKAFVLGDTVGTDKISKKPPSIVICLGVNE